MPARMRLWFVILVLVLLTFAITGCGSGTGGGGGDRGSIDTPVTLAVAYTGTSSVSGSTGHVAISINQNNNQVVGFMGFELQGVVNIGSYSGTLTGSSLAANFASSVPGQCSSTITATISGTTMSGTFSTVAGCATPQSGTFTLQESAAAPNMAGPASGNISDSILGIGTIALTVNQNGVTMNGTYTDSFGGDGLHYGMIVGSIVYFDLVPTDPAACSFAATGNLSANIVAGNYTAYNCSTVETGTFSITF